MTKPDDLVVRLRARAKANAAALRSISNGVEIARPDHKRFLEWEAADRIQELEAAIGRMSCPRPCNHRPDELTVSECIGFGECGCVAHVAAMQGERSSA